jgi:predicted nucleotidyltransferase
MRQDAAGVSEPNLGIIVPNMGSNKHPPGDPIGNALFGRTTQAILRLFFGHPERRFYQRQVIRMLGLGSGAVQRELAALAQAGIIDRAVEGRQAYYQASSRCPIFAELRALVQKTFGVADVIAEALRPLRTRISLAFIYGSVASGSEKAGSDVDLMVIGDEISLDDVVASIGEAQEKLGREVNPSLYRTEEFSRKLAKRHHFLSSVLAAPKIFLIGGDDDLARLAEGGMAEGAPDEPSRNRRADRRRRAGP